MDHLDLSTLQLDRPGWLWLLPVLAVAGAAGVRWRRSAGEPYAAAALRDSVAPVRPGWRRPAAVAGLVLATVALTAGAARPSVVADDAAERAVVVVALDTSSSMLATDVAPSRFAAAKSAAQAFVRDLPAQVDVGLVTYNATTTLVTAPTSSHEDVADAIDGLGMSGGTAMGDALQTSLGAVLRKVGGDASAARIVLLGDGGSTTGSDLQAAVDAAAAAHVPVSTIAYGTPDGVVVANGTTYEVPVDTTTLAAVAKDTGGTAYEAATAAQLRDVYDDIGTQLVHDTRREDVSDLAAVLGVLLLLGTAVPSLFLDLF